MLLTKPRAFSLIELLITISIVAILSAIAVAQMRNYAMRGKVSQAMIIFKNIGDKAKAYYDTHGAFPNLEQAGLYHDPLDPTQSPMASSLGNYTAKYVPYTFLSDQSNLYTCPAVGYGGYISNLFDGDYMTDAQSGSIMTVNLLMVYVEKTYRVYCQYFYYQYDQTTQDLTPQSGNFIPACENGTDDPNSGTYFTDAGNQCA